MFGVQRVNVFSISVFVGIIFITLVVRDLISQTNYDLVKQHENLCKEIYQTTKLYEIQAKWNEAVELLNIGIDIAKSRAGNKRSEAMLKLQLGNIYRLQRKFDEAIGFLEDAMALAESAGDEKIQGDCLFYIGYTYDHKQLFQNDGDYNVAREYYEKSLSIRESIGDVRGMGFSLFRLGRLLEMEGDDESAAINYEQVLAIVEKYNFKILANYVYSHLGFISERKENLNEALKYAELVIKINKEIHFKYDDPLSFLNLG